MSDTGNNEADDVAGSNNAIEQVNSAADTAFQEALENGATPEEAFDAACAAGEEAALEAGIPQEEIEARTEAAKEAFNQGLEEGKNPEECFEEAGVKVKGLEGSKFAFDHMMIDPANVEHFDLRKKYQPTHSVDLVISIEVAEHIEQLFVGNYVDVLTKHGASNIIMTAAAPGQGGEGHVNEQPAEYWVEKLQDAGYKRNLQLEENIIHWGAEARAVKDAPLELRRLTTDKVPTVKEAPNWQTEFDALHSSTDKLVNAHWDNVWIPWWFPRNLICYRKE